MLFVDIIRDIKKKGTSRPRSSCQHLSRQEWNKGDEEKGHWIIGVKERKTPKVLSASCPIHTLQGMWWRQ